MAATYFILKQSPPDLPADDAGVRLLYFGWVVEFGLKRKDWELARGLNAKGEPLPGVSASTRANRRSEMTPTGKGDPSAPYLMPGRGLSRTRSLLAGKAHADYAEFWWRYDAWTGDQWGKILAYHARRGQAYNVIGLSPQGRAWVAAQAAARWRKWKAGASFAPPVPMQTPAVAAAPISVPLVGRTNLDHATAGIGGSLDQARKAIAEGRSSGFMSRAEWDRYWRQARPGITSAAPGTSVSVQTGKSNVLLQHVWTPPPPAQAPPTAAAPKAPQPAPSPAPKKVAMKPVASDFEFNPRPPAARPTPAPVPAAPAAASPTPKPPKPAKLAKPAPALKPSPSPAMPTSLDGLRPVRSLGGSTGAELLEDAATGLRYVLKRGASPAHLKSEAAADAMYRAAGIEVPRSIVIDDASGAPVKLAEYVDGRTLGELKRSDPAAYEAAAEKLKDGFAVDALVGNWDVIGLDLDNVVVDAAGKVYRVDNGGSLTYRAQGAKKSAEQFARWTVGELASMRDPTVNPSAGGVFAGLSDSAVAAQVRSLVDARAAIIKASPPSLKKIVSARIDALERFAASRAQGWEPTPAREFAGRADSAAEAEAWAAKTYAGWAEALTEDQRSAIRGYTGEGYRSLNAMLRGEDPAKILVIDRIKLLDEALASRPLPEGRVVYRGFRDHRDVLKAMGVKRTEDIKPGMEYIDTGYKSTSAARDAAFDPSTPRGSLLLEIRLPAGTHAAGIQAVSQAPHEIEVLVGRHTDVFRVVEVRDDGTVVVEAMRSADLIRREGRR